MNLIHWVRDVRDYWRYADGSDFDQFMVAQGDASHLCTEFDDDGYPTPAGLAGGERFIARAKHWTPLAWKIYDLYGFARQAMTMLICEIKGHALVDESYGGPDSGCMAARCERCGWSFHHTLY